MATLTAEQIEQKKLRLKQLAEEMKALKDELVEAGVPNISHLNPLNRTPITESNPVEDLYHSDPIM